MWSAEQRKIEALSLAVLLGVMAASFAWIGLQVYAYRAYQMDLDEALHANRGLDIASALRRGSLTDLWAETVKPDWYPPAHGYLVAAWFLLVGVSTTSARIYAAVCFVLLGVLLWASAKEVFPNAPPLLLLTPALFLLSDNQHLIHASLSMLDLPANLLAMASLYFMVKSLDETSYRNVLLTSFFALLCTLTRYSHGIMLLAALALGYLLFSFRDLKSRIFVILAAWLPALLVLFAWLVILGEWKWLVAYSEVQPAQAWSLEELLFYPKQLLGESSGWLPLLLTCVGAFSWIRQKQINRRAVQYLIFFGVALALLNYRSEGTSRFGMVLLPPLWVVAVGGATELLQYLKKQNIRLLATGSWVILLVFLGIKNHISLPAKLSTAYENTNTGVNDAYQFIAQTLDIVHQERLKVVMFGENDSWSGFALHFYLQSQCLSYHPNCLINVTGERVMNKGWPPKNAPEEVRNKRVEETIAAADYLTVFAKTPILPDGWVEVARREFVFARYKIESKNYQVVILRRAVATAAP